MSGQECALGWCDEHGPHDTHRQYVGSRPAGHGRWLLGVNVIQTTTGQEDFAVELTAAGRHHPAVSVPVEPAEAARFGLLVTRAAHHAARRARKAARQRQIESPEKGRTRE